MIFQVVFVYLFMGFSSIAFGEPNLSLDLSDDLKETTIENNTTTEETLKKSSYNIEKVASANSGLDTEEDETVEFIDAEDLIEEEEKEYKKTPVIKVITTKKANTEKTSIKRNLKYLSEALDSATAEESTLVKKQDSLDSIKESEREVASEQVQTETDGKRSSFSHDDYEIFLLDSDKETDEKPVYKQGEFLKNQFFKVKE